MGSEKLLTERELDEYIRKNLSMNIEFTENRYISKDKFIEVSLIWKDSILKKFRIWMTTELSIEDTYESTS